MKISTKYRINFKSSLGLGVILGFISMFIFCFPGKANGGKDPKSKGPLIYGHYDNRPNVDKMFLGVGAGIDTDHGKMYILADWNNHYANQSANRQIIFGFGTTINHINVPNYQRVLTLTDSYVHAERNVGIGLPHVGVPGVFSPNAKLHISDASRKSILLQISDNSKGNGIAFQNSDGWYTWNIYRRNVGNNRAQLVFAGGSSDDVTELENYMNLTDAGRVGIGVNTPEALLHVNGDSKVEGVLTVSGDIVTTGRSIIEDEVMVKDHLVFATTGTGANIPDYITNTENTPANATGLSFFVDDVERMRLADQRKTFMKDTFLIGNIETTVPGSILTIAGSTHIGPASLDPTVFNYTDQTANYLLWVENGIVTEDLALAAKGEWSDFVFEENYELRSLEEVEAFIKKNKHLPNIPSASQVAEEGYIIHDMNKRFLQQIEELTLYNISQQNEIKSLKARLLVYEELNAELAALKEEVK